MGRGLALAFMLLALAGAGLAFVKPSGWARSDLMRIHNDRNAAERAALDKSVLAVKADLARMTADKAADKAEAERLAGMERDQAARKLADLDTHLKGVMARAVDADRAADLARQEIVRLAAVRDELAARLATTQAEADKALAQAREDATRAREDAARARVGQPDNATEAEFEKRLAAVRTEAAERFMAARNEADRQITAALADTAKCRAELEKVSAKPTDASPPPACTPAPAADAGTPSVVPAAEIAQHLGTEGHISLYVPFDTGSAVVKPNALPSIEPIAAALRQDPKLKLLLVGHTDTQGDFGFNRTLSENRAKAIVDSLIAKYGIDRARLSYAGVADLAPIASNDTDAGRQRNRRVELVKR